MRNNEKMKEVTAMECKKIVFTEINKAELLTETVREMGENDVLVDTFVTTISSGTERANITGDPFVTIASAVPTVNFPRTAGYSAAGVVMAVGENVKSVKVGDRVALSWSKHTNLQVLNEKNVHLIESDKVSYAAAALTHIATFPMAAIRKCRLEMGESAMVMGLGILGLLAVQLLRAAGAVPVIAVDPNPDRRQKALQLGADYAFDPFAADFVETVKNASHGGVNVAIEVTGNGPALNQALDCMAKLGRVALLGCTRQSDFTVDYYHKVHGPGISLIGAHTNARPNAESSAGYWTDHDDAMAVLRLCGAGRIDLDAMIEETHAPEEAPQIFQRLIHEKSFPVVQFDWTRMKREG